MYFKAFGLFITKMYPLLCVTVLSWGKQLFVCSLTTKLNLFFYGSFSLTKRDRISNKTHYIKVIKSFACH